MAKTTTWCFLISFSFAPLLLQTGCSSNFEEFEKDFGKLKRKKTSSKNRQENENSQAICESALRIQTTENTFPDSNQFLAVEISDSQGKKTNLTLDSKNLEQKLSQLCPGKATLKLFLMDNFLKTVLSGSGELILNAKSSSEVNIVLESPSRCQGSRLTLQSNLTTSKPLTQPVNGCAEPNPHSFFNYSASTKNEWRTTFTSASGFVRAEQYTTKTLEIQFYPPNEMGKVNIVPTLAKLTESICVGQPQVCQTKVATIFSEQSFDYLVKTLNSVKKSFPPNPHNKPLCSSDAPSVSIAIGDLIYREDLGCVTPTFFEPKSLQDAWSSLTQYLFPEECRTID